MFSWIHRPLARRLLIGIAAVAMVIGCAAFAFRISERRGASAAREETNHRLDLFAAAMQGVGREVRPGAATGQLNPEGLQLLRQPASEQRAEAVSDYLRRLNAHVGSIAAYVLNDRGVVLASSTSRPGDDSSLGEDISFRPYFLEALSGRVGRHFAIGIKGNR